MENKTIKAGQYLSFLLDNQFYGVPIEFIREINQMTEITPVPESPRSMVGVINLRGKVIPVVDLRIKFQLAQGEFTKETCIVVIDSVNGQVGTIVDCVRDVIDLEEKDIEPSPDLGGKESHYLMGMGKLEDKVVILVDIGKALESFDIEAISQQAKMHGINPEEVDIEAKKAA